MNGSAHNSRNNSGVLTRAYRQEGERLARLASSDTPQGDYLHPVYGKGRSGAEIILIGEAPGREEAEAGEPFIGKAGKQLTLLLEKAGLSRERLYITNVVKYRPVRRGENSIRNRTPGKPEILQSLPLLRIELETIRPRIIVTLGNTPLFAACALLEVPYETIGTMHGKGYAAHLRDEKVALFPLYHPASGIYNPKLIVTMEQDILQFGEKLVKGTQ